MSDPYDIELSHTFSAPAARVWAALTDPDQFVRWYGPDGFPVDPGPWRSTPESAAVTGS